MNEKQKKAFVILMFSYLIFIISMLLNLFWSRASEGDAGASMAITKDLILRMMYLLFCVLAISSFVTIAKENKKSKAPISQLIFPSFLIIVPSLILLGQVISLIQIITH